MTEKPFILFDLDNTLYSPATGVMKEMNRRMILFTAEYLGVTEEEASEMRREKPLLFGTTLQWLRVCHGMMNPEPYIAAVHPGDIESWIAPDPLLRKSLSSLESDFVLFTNSPLEHADRTLKALGIDDLFPRIWDIRRMGYRGKPQQDSYRRILGDLGLAAGDCILVDDNEANLSAFREMGGHIFPVRDEPVSIWFPLLEAELDNWGG